MKNSGKRKQAIYLAGPMTGIDGFNREEFFKAEKTLLKLPNVTVLNPAALPVDLPEKAYMPICLAMLEQADVIALLPGWEGSEGAVLEKQYAERQRKKVLYLVERCST